DDTRRIRSLDLPPAAARGSAARLDRALVRRARQVGPSPRNRAGRRRRGSRVGARLPASQGRRPVERRLLVPAGEAADALRRRRRGVAHHRRHFPRGRGRRLASLERPDAETTELYRTPPPGDATGNRQQILIRRHFFWCPWCAWWFASSNLPSEAGKIDPAFP